MALRVSTIRCWYALWLALLALASLVVCQDEPKHAITSFNNIPARIFFFDDTESAILHDVQDGDVYVSQDEGKSWSKADGIPPGKAAMVIEHPFNNRIAFTLTDGTKHYRTEDRGKTWRSFEMPIFPARVQRPLSFHSDSQKDGYILYQGTACEGIGWNAVCHDETYYTLDGFSSAPKKLREDTSRCQFAHSSKDFEHDAHPDLIYCVAFDAPSSNGRQTLEASRLYSSTDFFQQERKIEELGIGKNAKGVVALAIVSKFAVVALRDFSEASDGEMLLYVTVDTKNWAKAQFPRASSAKLRENAYTIVEGTTHSLGVDVLSDPRFAVGTLFVSNSNGTFFVESLKDTNRNTNGFVDYEQLYGIDGVGLANTVANAKDVETRRASKLLKTQITYTDGRAWSYIKPPPEDSDGKRIHCDLADVDSCSLHLHSVTNPHNFGRIFSSPAPGFAMGVGSIGEHLKPYEECDTFLSTDAGQTWKMVRKDAHQYEFGDQGSILVVVNDEDLTDVVRYSLDLGKTWKAYKLGINVRARAFLTLPDSTSQKFLLLGQVPRKEQTKEIKSVVVIYLDFSPTRKRKCEESDFERWYARKGDSKCIMGHQQWYKRRKAEVDCYVGEKYADPLEHEEKCQCGDDDYECDYNFILQDGKCVPAGPEPIPAGICKEVDGTYQGSSGYRKIPGNTCEGGIQKATPVEKPCSKAQPAEGDIVHQISEFRSEIAQHAYFNGSTTILVRLRDATMWQSSNEGYTFQQLFPDKRILAFYHHKFTPDRAYLITDTEEFFYTTNTGQNWNLGRAPSPPNTFGAQVLSFHPTESDRIIWIGNVDCAHDGPNCHAQAKYSLNNGKTWELIDNYVKTCAWARDAHLEADPTEIICESWKNKKGSQRQIELDNHLELIAGSSYYERQKKLFDNVVGFAKFSEFLVVAELLPEKRALELQVSLDGNRFAGGQFPPSMHPTAHAYTILQSNTGSLFLHMTMSEPPLAPYWGNILKSNWNGTYFGLSAEYVNRNEEGYVDFEKVIGLDGIALINVVADPDEAVVTKRKKLQTRITHNDGATWKPLNPPAKDSLGNDYECQGTKCALHIHGYTERRDPRATYSSPGIVGLLMAVGNVGESLKPYKECDTFLSRDAGFTWQEIHKDAHMWEFGDSGSILVIVNDEGPTDHVLFSTDEGLTWRDYRFSDEKIRVDSIVTVNEDDSRRFILLGKQLRSPGSVAINIDFSSLTLRKCVLDEENPNQDDFELWSPSIEREERCLFGRRTFYHRRARDANCVVGNKPRLPVTVENCACSSADFECEFNHVRNAAGECVLVPGTEPRSDPDDRTCQNEDYWYERTPYRLISHSSCEGGDRPDRGKQHVCPGFKSKGPLFWLFMLLLPFTFTALVAYYYYRRSGLAKGMIRLPGDGFAGSDNAFHRALDTLASVPWFLIGIARIAVESISSRYNRSGLRGRRGYRNVPIDEDAQVLRFEDEE